ncbi:transposase [Haloferula luteola]|uniref:Transposase n=1 Tax=Haloferula luteola TaxID=595692 RepID=A0A840V4X8_9BACT|nr:transposase [Haloferula luteola]
MREDASSLTDSAREIIHPLLSSARMDCGEGPREHSRRSILNGNFAIIRASGSWRMMPHDLPH